jgi:voltage-gated potassium channel Kch
MLVASPLLTVGVVADALKHLIKPETIAKRLTGHIVLCGHGEHGRSILDAARKQGLGGAAGPRHVVVIERDATPAREVDGTWFIQGDGRDPHVLKLAGAERAAVVIFATGDPLVNLAGAQAARKLMQRPSARLVALVDAVDLPRDFTQALGLAGDNTHLIDTHLIDQFKVAATAAVKAAREQALPHGSEGLHVALLGFGRFGRAVLAQLFPERPPEATSAGTSEGAAAQQPVHKVTIVDEKLRWLNPHQQRLQRGGQITVCSGVDAAEWCQSHAEVSSVHVVIIGLSNAVVALQCAALLRQRSPPATLVLRGGPRRATGGGTAEKLCHVQVAAACAQEVIKTLSPTEPSTPT